MKRSGCAFNIMLLLTFLCQRRALADDYMLKLAERYYKAGDYQNAANSWESALVSSPNSAYAHYMRANALVKLNQISEAKAEYARAGALDPNGSIGAYSNQGLANLTPRYAVGQKPNAGSMSLEKLPNNEKPEAKSADREMSEFEQRLNAERDAKIAAINRETEDKIKVLQEEHSEQIAANGQPAYKQIVAGYGPYGPIMQTVPYYDPGPANEAIDKEYAVKEDVVRGQALQRILETKDYYAKRIAAAKAR